MVVKMMRWRPWPLLISRKFEVKLAELRFEGGDWMQESPEKENGSLAVEIRWKGPKFSLGSFRRSVKRNCTREENVRRVDELNGAVLVEWGEEFQTICSLSGYKDNAFHPWEINFTVLHGMYQGVKNKYSVVGSAVLNLADYMSRATEPAIDLKIPLTLSGGGIEHCPFLHISLGLLELRATLEPTELLQSPIIPVPSPAAFVETSSTEKDEVSALKAGFRKVKLFTEYVSIRKAKKACREEEGSDGRCSVKSEGDYAYPADSDSLEDSEDGETEENKEESTVRKSFSYGTLAHANYVGVSYYSSTRISNEAEDLIYYSNRRRSDVGCSRVEDSSFSMPDKLLIENSKRSILPWRKRKLSFRSPPKTKGEPLLKKAYGEDGGDDIDFDRRQLSSDESLSFGQSAVVNLIKSVVKSRKEEKQPLKIKDIVTSCSGLYRFSKAEIKRAINYGPGEKCLGRGSSGWVYKGTLPSGQIVAIKQICKSDTSDSFSRAIEGMSSVRHSNLVCLIGYCIEDGEQYLVYEYCSNGNLAQCLLSMYLSFTFHMIFNLARRNI